MKKPVMLTVCYKFKDEYIARRKLEWDTCLAWYSGKNLEQTQKEVDELNRNHPEKDWRGCEIKWDIIDYFFVDAQEMFDTTGN